MASKKRCWWCESDPIYVEYHDNEWGRPVHDDGKHFEMLILEGFQAGLSWITILKRRENFRKAFHRFNPKKVSKMTSRDVFRLLKDEGIIRHRGKIEAAINNAKCFLEIQDEFGSFDDYIWSFVGGKTLRTKKNLTRDGIPAKTKESDMLSKDLKKRGFKFVGSTTCYAHMQAAGLVDDHVKGCYRYKSR